MAATSIDSATSAQTMNGSLPPSSRLIRATRSAADARDLLAGVDRAGEGDAVDALVLDDASPTSPAPASTLTTPAGRCAKHGASASVDSGVSSDGLATTVLPAASAGASFQDEEQQRVVPRHDAGDDAHRLLQHERELRGLDRRDHASAEVAAHLGVVVEGRGGPRRPRPDSRRAAFRPRGSSARRARLCGRAAASPPRAAARRARPPASAAQPRAASRAAAMAASTCSSEARPTVAIVSSSNGFSTSSGPPDPATCSPPMRSRVSVNAWPSRA